MFRKVSILVLAVTILLSFAGCGNKNELNDLTKAFCDIINGTIPQDMRLTIYYFPYYIESVTPFSVENLKDHNSVQVISVSYEDLVKHQDQFKKFDSTLLKPRYRKTYVDARLYYIFELGDSGSILEYVYSYDGGSDFVNGIPIKHNSQLIDMVSPFLPENCIYKHYDLLGLS